MTQIIYDSLLGGLTVLTLNKGAQGCQEGCLDQYQPFFLPAQRPEAWRESHLSYGWIQTPSNDIEHLSFSLTLLSSALALSSGRLLFTVAKWSKVTA